MGSPAIPPPHHDVPAPLPRHAGTAQPSKLTSSDATPRLFNLQRTLLILNLSFQHDLQQPQRKLIAALPSPNAAPPTLWQPCLSTAPKGTTPTPSNTRLTTTRASPSPLRRISALLEMGGSLRWHLPLRVCRLRRRTSFALSRAVVATVDANM